jgi:hypothetical protein
VTDEGNRVGVKFRPSNSLTRVDIEGVLWLDPASHELQEIEYRYTKLPYRVSDRRVGGLVQFHRGADGRWFISRWKIRMPIVAELVRPDLVPSLLRDYRVVGYREEGAVIDWGS